MLDLPDDLMILLCTKPKDARIHVDFLGGLQPERLQQRISPTGSWTHVVAFRPTGVITDTLHFGCISKAKSSAGSPTASCICSFKKKYRAHLEAVDSRIHVPVSLREIMHIALPLYLLEEDRGLAVDSGRYRRLEHCNYICRQLQPVTAIICLQAISGAIMQLAAWYVNSLMSRYTSSSFAQVGPTGGRASRMCGRRAMSRFMASPTRSTPPSPS